MEIAQVSSGSPVHLVILGFLLVLFVVVVLLVLWAIRGSNGNAQESAVYRGVSAKERIDQRYASGEISREEYLTIKSDIMGSNDA